MGKNLRSIDRGWWPKARKVQFAMMEGGTFHKTQVKGKSKEKTMVLLSKLKGGNQGGGRPCLGG